MSRSFKKTSVTGNSTAKSEKTDKRICNRKVRRKNNVYLKKCSCVDYDACSYVLFLPEEALDSWLMAKDGKRYFNRKSYPKLMRK